MLRSFCWKKNCNTVSNFYVLVYFVTAQEIALSVSICFYSLEQENKWAQGTKRTSDIVKSVLSMQIVSSTIKRKTSENIVGNVALL